jgi:uncharacterized PurR-regulated membrane protein YhhQ (DUF165 family)
MKHIKLVAAVATYVAAIVLANWLTATFGLVAVGFGLLVTAGTFAAGFALLARDFVHRFSGARTSVACVLVGAAISWALASPALAVASVTAFLASEFVDLGVFSRLRGRGFTTGALGSNLVSIPVDTVIFLSIAGFPLTFGAVVGQMIGKWVWATCFPVAVYLLGTRAVLRQPKYVASS